MPSKRKRAGPGYNRDDASAPKRTKPAYNQVYRVASRNISGPGIFVTCVQGKERKAALQFIDLLNEVADRIYPGVAPQPLPQPENEKEKEEEEEDDEDALRNGAAPGVSPSASVAKAKAAKDQSEKSDAKKEGDHDIAAQIAAELSDIKASERISTASSSRRNNKSTSGPVRFRNVETDTECFLFISVCPPLDPYKLVYTILAEVETTGEPRSRFVQRLTPVSTTTGANIESLTSHAHTVLPQFFPPCGPGRSFKIDPRIRSHSKLKRNGVIHTIASCIPTKAGDEGEREKMHTANLTKPDYWIVVEIVKNCAAISVVGEYERWKKLNVQSVAQAANERRASERGNNADQGRIGASLVAKPPQPPTSLQSKVGEKDKEEEEAIATNRTTDEAVESQATPTGKRDDDQDQMANFRLL